MPISNLFKGIQNMWLGTDQIYKDLIMPAMLMNGSGLAWNMDNADQVSVVFTCIKTLADTIARMPIDIYTDKGEGRTVDTADYRYPLLHYNPNNWTSSMTFFQSLEYWRNLKGNAFAKIYRDGSGRAASLVLIPPSMVTGYNITDGELYYIIKNTKDKEEVINSSEVLHFRTITRDGIWGVNPIEALRMNVSSTFQGLNTIDKFYQNNAASPKALKSTVSGANQKAMLEALEEFKRKYAGSSNAGQIIPLPPNTEVIDLALNYADAEFINTLKFNATQIGALYGIPPHMLGILEATKFNNVEMMMLDFKATTLTAITRMYRQELEHKLLTTTERLNGISIEHNFNSLVEADYTTRVNNEKTLLSMGVATINDIAKLEGYTTYPEGNEHYIPGNYMNIKDIGKKQNPPPPSTF